MGQPGSFPTAVEVVDAGVAELASCGLTGRRATTLVALAEAVAGGELTLDPGADREHARATLLAIAGIGPWTAEYVALRALADPDAWPSTDLVLARRAAAEGFEPARWRPWRGYAAMHLWTDSTRRGTAQPDAAQPDREPR
jgi:AraC family transcriptional regulator of adaptative response / DNA-3-methyladenine glycosylase II